MLLQLAMPFHVGNIIVLVMLEKNISGHYTHYCSNLLSTISPILIHPVPLVALPPSVPLSHHSNHPSPLTLSFQVKTSLFGTYFPL